MSNPLKSLRKSLQIIVGMPDIDQKLTTRAAMIFVFILERETPATYEQMEAHLGVKQQKLASTLTILQRYGLISRTSAEVGARVKVTRVAYAPTELGERIRAALLKGESNESP